MVGPWTPEQFDRTEQLAKDTINSRNEREGVPTEGHDRILEEKKELDKRSREEAFKKGKRPRVNGLSLALAHIIKRVDEVEAKRKSKGKKEKVEPILGGRKPGGIDIVLREKFRDLMEEHKLTKEYHERPSRREKKAQEVEGPKQESLPGLEGAEEPGEPEGQEKLNPAPASVDGKSGRERSGKESLLGVNGDVEAINKIRGKPGGLPGLDPTEEWKGTPDQILRIAVALYKKLDEMGERFQARVQELEEENASLRAELKAHVEAEWIPQGLFLRNRQGEVGVTGCNPPHDTEVVDLNHEVKPK